MDWQPYLLLMLDELAISSWRAHTNSLVAQLRSTRELIKLLKNDHAEVAVATRLGILSGICDKLINEAEDVRKTLEGLVDK